MYLLFKPELTVILHVYSAMKSNTILLKQCYLKLTGKYLQPKNCEFTETACECRTHWNMHGATSLAEKYSEEV